MIDTHDHDLHLTPDAEAVAEELVALGAIVTSGHRSVAGQARAMAVNVAQNRDWIGQVYRHGAALQLLVFHHPEWVTSARIGEELYKEMILHPELTKDLSHHLQYPCPCFDLDPDTVNDQVKAMILAYQQEQVITQVLWKEGGFPKCHIEVGHLRNVKV